MRRLIPTIALTLAVIMCVGRSVSARSIDIVFDDHTVRAQSYNTDDVEYVSLTDLMRAFEAPVEWDPAAQRLRAQLDGRIWTFWGNSALVSIDKEVGGLGNQVRVIDDHLYAPLRPLASLLSQFSGMSALAQGQALRVQHRETALLGYQITDRANGLMIDLNFTRPVPYEVYESEGHWLNMTLHRTRLSPRELNAHRPHHDVLEVKALQFDSSAQISFRMRNPLTNYVVRRGDIPGRVTILFGDAVASTPWTPTPPSPAYGAATPEVRTIVIDPGHGGDDHGAKSRDGVILEKDVAMVLAERTANKLDDDKRFNVVLTRDDDEDLTTAERVARVRDAGADLYIGIHTTAFDSDAGRGCQSFFLGEATNNRARTVADDVNGQSSPDATGLTPVVAAPTDELQRGSLRTASSELARLIQEQFENRLAMPSRGVDQAEFTILQQIDVPGVILCIGALGNLDDVDRLRRRSFQKDVAEAIADGILAFTEMLNQQRVTAKGD